MSVYGQEAEARLLTSFLARLEDRSVVDVGAERGAFADELLRGGATELYAIEPEPRNADALRDRFGDPRVRVLELAAGDTDGELPLHLSVSPSGDPITFGHTTLERPATDEIQWDETLIVPTRSLGSLVRSGELPARVGVVKIDTEGHDLAVVAGMGDLICDVVMVEHWVDLPNSLGVCPWSSDEMVEALRTRGFSHFAFIVHRGEFVLLQWDDAGVSPGAMGNLVFIHDRVLNALLPDVLERASSLAEVAVERAVAGASEAEERRAELERVTQRPSDASAIQELAQERDVQAKAAEERLVTIAELQHELELQTMAAEERLRSIDDLKREVGVHAAAAAERLETIEALEQDRDLHRRAADERLSALDAVKAQIAQLKQERDLQAQAAAERLEAIEALERDRDLHRQAAEDRLDALHELARERDRQAVAAEQRLAAMEDLDRDRNAHSERGHDGWR